MCAVALGAAPANAATFSNAGLITINPGGTATPYPSSITVSGLGPSVADVNATLSGFSQTWPPDVDVLLVSPPGQSAVLMSDVPPRDFPACTDDVVATNLTFDDGAAGPIPPATLASGTYQPTDNDLVPCGPLDDAFAGPAPAGPYGSTLTVFNGTNPNGTWSLYVIDDAGGDGGSTSSGSISSGWSLDIKTSNVFSFGKVKRNQNKGTATLVVNVPGPGTLSLTGKGVKTQRTGRPAGAAANKAVSAEGTAKLRIKAKGKKKRRLNDTGK
jgi:hypothetical protein